MRQEKKFTKDNSNKSILARGCDPRLSTQFAQIASQVLGNVEYIPTWNDKDFIEKLKSQKWSVIYFAPGACRYSAQKMQIPGGNQNTKGWTLDDYSKLVYELQGDEIQIVETPYEQDALPLLKEGLDASRVVK